MSEQPIVAGRAPLRVDVEAGKSYWWCACGHSQSQPFCDGSHAGTGLEPLEYTAEESGTLRFCVCKQTKKPPLCDGSHKTA
jgi:CDGSH-type Zn-finger protein